MKPAPESICWEETVNSAVPLLGMDSRDRFHKMTRPELRHKVKTFVLNLRYVSSPRLSKFLRATKSKLSAKSWT